MKFLAVEIYILCVCTVFILIGDQLRKHQRTGIIMSLFYLLGFRLF